MLGRWGPVRESPPVLGHPVPVSDVSSQDVFYCSSVKELETQ